MGLPIVHVKKQEAESRAWKRDADPANKIKAGSGVINSQRVLFEQQDEDGEILKAKTTINLGDQPAYAPGKYVIDASSFQIGTFGLELARSGIRLVRFPEGK